MSVLLGNTWRVSVLGVVLSLIALSPDSGNQAVKQSNRHVPVVEDLVQLLQAQPDLRESFNAWMKRYVKARGEFLDTPASAA